MNTPEAVQVHDIGRLKEIEAEQLKTVNDILVKIYDIWKEFGIDNEQKIQRARNMWNHVHCLLKEIHDEENVLYREVKVRIDAYTKKISELSTLLCISSFEVSEASLIKKEEILRQQLDRLTKLKNKRLKIYQDLRNEELNLCKILNFPVHIISSTCEVPSENDLSELEQHIASLKEEKDQRCRKLYTVKRELTTILEVTELTPQTTLEQEIISGKDMLLSDDTFKALEDMVHRAKIKQSELESQQKVLLDKLAILWQWLKTEDIKKEAFLSTHADCRPSTLKYIQQEIDKCEQIKKENIKLGIDAAREELKQLWAKCFASESEKGKFSVYSSDTFNEETLKEYETEIQQWKKYYEDIKDIVNKINKRQELWNLLIIFENKASDTNRLKNRKGNLLQEEKQRKRLLKELPALEDNIVHDIEMYEKQTGRKFLYNGGDFSVAVTAQWEQRLNQKENEKLMRRKHRIIQIENEVTLQTPDKRSLPTTPKSCPTKLFKSSDNMSVYRTPNSLGKVTSRIPHQSKRTLYVSGCVQTRCNAVQKRNKCMVLKGRNNNKATAIRCPNDMTYTDFADELNKTSRMAHHSSVLSSRKVVGTRISQKSGCNKKITASKKLQRTLVTSGKLTPARGKLGLPFLI